MFAESSILKTIALVSQVLHQYERVGGFAPPTASEAAEPVPEASAAGTESVADASAPPPTSEGQEACLPQPAEAAESTATAAAAVGVLDRQPSKGSTRSR
jgi:hypothetical protein